ncbi:MAG: Uma2 family endonuclease [Planctomycetia bacterium]|nr:Uma2 family endonuclease [Planctomycetia bacterium]
MTPTTAVPVQQPTDFPWPNVKLVESDGEPMDTPWHRDAMNLLIEQVRWQLRDRQDYFVGGNMFIYFNVEQARNRDFRGPDFFFVDGAQPNEHRLWWAIGEEGGKYPDVIIELLSPTTAVEDRTTKKQVYERTFRTGEYFLYDPTTRQLDGWRLLDRRYQRIEPDARGWLWCDQLKLWLGVWGKAPTRIGLTPGCASTTPTGTWSRCLLKPRSSASTLKSSAPRNWKRR